MDLLLILYFPSFVFYFVIFIDTWYSSFCNSLWNSFETVTVARGRPDLHPNIIIINPLTLRRRTNQTATVVWPEVCYLQAIFDTAVFLTRVYVMAFPSPALFHAACTACITCPLWYAGVRPQYDIRNRWI